MRKPRTPVPADEVLRTVISSSVSFDAAAWDLGLSVSTVKRRARRLGVRPVSRVRQGLPDEATLTLEMTGCASYRAVADRYGVAEYTIRNEGKRLGITPPTKRALVCPVCRAHA